MSPIASPPPPVSSGPVRSIVMSEGRYEVDETPDGHWKVRRPDGTVSSEVFDDRFAAYIAVAERRV